MSGSYLEGRVAVVTGAGRGLGRSHALKLARLGASVVVNDLGIEVDGVVPSSEPATEVVEEIAAAGGRAAASYDDIATADGARALVDQAVESFGRLDVVVNNAGIVHPGLFVDLEPTQIQAVVGTNLVGTMLVTHAAARHWRSRSEGGEALDARLINTASSGGLYGFCMCGAYAGAKGGVVSFTATMAEELRDYGVTANVICPIAATRTTVGEHTTSDNDVVAGSMALSMEIDRPVTAADFDPAFVSPLVAWLAGPDASGVTGRVFEVSAGRVFVDDGWHRREVVDHQLDTDVRELGAEVGHALERMPELVPPLGTGGYSREGSQRQARLARATT